jgi:pyruvate kinase
MMKRTKIICTLGPAVDSESALKNLVIAGMDVARCNFSHGSHAEHKARMDRLKKVRRELDAPVAIMLDTKGPSIRTGKLEGGNEVLLRAGDNFFLTEEEVLGNSRRVHQTCKGLWQYVEPGTIILVDDGLIELAVDRVQGTEIQCTVQNSGTLGECKQINLPGTEVPLPVMTEQDKEDLLFGIEQEVDFVAASFVSCGEDVEAIRQFLTENGGSSIRIVAKIENAHAVEHIDDIIEASDAVMVARGDLGVEVPSNQVPHLQKKIIKACNRAFRPAICATQMLDSMIRNPRPTRAEVADVANAIYDGADALTLSGETAIGMYAVPAVQTMAQIAVASEPYLYAEGSIPNRVDKQNGISTVVGLAAATTAENVGASCIVTPTMTGRTARLVSNYRPKVPIYAVTTTEAYRRSLQLNWGVTALVGKVVGDASFILEQACSVVKKKGFVNDGDICVFTLGDRTTSPHLGSYGKVVNFDKSAPSPRPTNVMQVVQIGVETETE